MRALVVVNHAATATSPRRLDVLLSALRHDAKVDVAETTHRGHATDLARAARADQLDLVLALGGDGTINEIVNGLLDDAAGPAAPDLAIVPGGSTNVLARSLGIPSDPVEATGLVLDAVRTGKRRAIGLGRLDSRWFTFCAGAGLDADVVREVERLRAAGKRSTNSLYVRTAARRLLAQHRRRRGMMTVQAASAAPVTGVALAIVTNTAPWTYLGHRPIDPTPLASFDRGLDLFAVTKLTVPAALRRVGELLLVPPRGERRHVVTLHDQRELVLRCDEPFPVQVDGDFIGERRSVTIRAVPAALRITL